MGELTAVLLLLAGELTGDAAFFLMGFRGRKRVDMIPGERSKQYCICKYSVFSVLASIVACLGLRGVLAVAGAAAGDAAGWYVRIRTVAESLGSLSCTAVFMFFYCRFRGGLGKLFGGKDAVVLEVTEDPRGIYLWNERSGRYELSEKWIYIKDCLKFILLINFGLLAAVHLFLADRGILGSVFSFRILEVIPVGASAVLLEFYNYLSLGDRSFFLRKRDSASADEPELNLVRLKADYEREKLPGLTVPMKIRKNEICIADAMQDYMKRCYADENPYIQYFAGYLERCRWWSKRYYNTGCLETAVRLVRGENLFCASPFYKDIDICIFFPAFLALARGKKALILIEDCGNLDGFARWVKEGIEEVQGLEDFFQVSILKETEEDADVGILSFQDVYRPEEFVWLNGFFREVGFVAVLEASGLLAGGQEALYHLSGQVGRASEECVWLLCDNNAESMLDLFSHLLRKQFVYVSATALPAEEALTGFWNVEEERRTPWEPVRHYLGAEIQAAEIAWRNNVNRITLYGEEVAPVYDIKWIVGQYYREAYKRTGKAPHQYALDDGITAEISGNACRMEDRCFLIAEDVNFNLYEVARQYLTRASRQIILHILSPNYMLRDFMKSREESMLADPKYIAQFVPEYVNTRRNVAVRFIRRMLREPVAESEIREELDKSEEWQSPFEGAETVRELVSLIMPAEENAGEGFVTVSYAVRFDEDAGENVREKYYQIQSVNVKKRFAQYFQKACYVDEDGEKRHINKLILGGHLDQKYLKGQMAVFNGLYYEIIKRRKTDYEYTLQVRRASEQVLGRRYYRQDRHYKLHHLEFYPYSSTDLQHEHLCVSRYRADIEAGSSGYYACKGWNEIAGAAYISLREEDVSRRSYRAKQLLKVELAIEDSEEAEVAVVQLACLLQESFCTFFPQHYHLLSVALDRSRYCEKEGAVLRGVLADVWTDSREKGVCFYIIEDSMEDMGLLRSLERNFQRILGILSEYMDWSLKSQDTYLLFGRPKEHPVTAGGREEKSEGREKAVDHGRGTK